MQTLSVSSKFHNWMKIELEKLVFLNKIWKLNHHIQISQWTRESNRKKKSRSKLRKMLLVLLNMLLFTSESIEYIKIDKKTNSFHSKSDCQSIYHHLPHARKTFIAICLSIDWFDYLWFRTTYSSWLITVCTQHTSSMIGNKKSQLIEREKSVFVYRCTKKDGKNTKAGKECPKFFFYINTSSERNYCSDNWLIAEY